MPPEPTGRDYVLFAVVFGGFVLVVIVGLVSSQLDRALGAGLLVVGTLALVYAPRLSAAKAAVGERWPLWPEPNTLRPFTVRLWGFGVASLGALMIAGI